MPLPFLDLLLGTPHPQNIMATPSQSISGASSSSEANVFGAFGAVLGYIGAEAATVAAFERLLWPQRSYSNFKFQSLLPVLFFTSMSGPKHKVALSVLDRVFQHGLLKGSQQGHMLGTSFFPQQDWTYTMHDDGAEDKAHTEPLRNCLWARVLSQFPMLSVQRLATSQSPDRIEKGNVKATQTLRAQVAVSHITFSKATKEDMESDLPFVSEDTKTPSLPIFLAIFTSELMGILTAIFVYAAFNSTWAALWLAPLLIQLFSTCVCLRREELVSTTSSSAANDPSCDFEIHCPQSEGNFMLFSGPPTLVLQFFRHYGHPKRDRVRETLQLCVIVLFACLFPIELLCSMVWMPPSIQYVWLSYQLYIVFVMHVARYSHLGASATTEAKIIDAFSQQRGGRIISGAGRQCSILLGHQQPKGPQTLKVDLSVTYHGRNQEGRKQLEKLLLRPRIPAKE